MQAREDLLDTIQRLLALSSSPNEHEAQLAMAKAHELIARHNLSMAEVQAADSHYDSREAWEGTRVPVEFPAITPILVQFFFVRGFVKRCRATRTSRVILFGEPHNVEIAEYLLSYLLMTYRRLARAAGCPRRGYRSYTVGLGTGLISRLQRDRDALQRGTPGSTNALVRIDEALDLAFDHAHKCGGPRKRPPVTTGLDWAARGVRDAQKITLRTGLRGPQQRLLLS